MKHGFDREYPTDDAIDSEAGQAYYELYRDHEWQATDSESYAYRLGFLKSHYADLLRDYNAMRAHLANVETAVSKAKLDALLAMFL